MELECEHRQFTLSAHTSKPPCCITSQRRYVSMRKHKNYSTKLEITIASQMFWASHGPARTCGKKKKILQYGDEIRLLLQKGSRREKGIIQWLSWNTYYWVKVHESLYRQDHQQLSSLRNEGMGHMHHLTEEKNPNQLPKVKANFKWAIEMGSHKN